MKKLILCGCSLGESWMPYFDGKKRDNDSTPDHNYQLGHWKKVTRFQQAGGTQGLMLYRLLNHFLVNEIKDTTIMVQLTGYKRSTTVSDQITNSDVTYQNNITDNYEFIICDQNNQSSGEADTASLIQVLCMLSKLGANVYVFRGWPGVCKPKEWETTYTILNDAGVITTELDYLTLAHNSKIDDWIDDKHPGVRLGCIVFDNIWKELNAY